jgi:hypothetical protein
MTDLTRRKVQLVYESSFLKRLAAYGHSWTAAWTYDERLDALEQLVLEDEEVAEHLWDTDFLKGLVMFKPTRLVTKLRELYPERDASHHAPFSYDAEDEDGNPVYPHPDTLALERVGAAVRSPRLAPNAAEEDTSQDWHFELETVLQRIPEHHAETLRLWLKHGSNEEAAKEAGVTPNAFRVRKHRAIEAAKAVTRDV